MKSKQNNPYTISLILWIVLTPLLLFSQDLFLDNFAQKMVDMGFEHVQIYVGNDRELYIEYENRAYREELLAMGIVLALVDQAIGTEENVGVTLIPQHRGLALCEIQVFLPDYQDYLKGQLSEKYFYRRMNISGPENHRPLNREMDSGVRNPSFGKIDLLFSPGMAYQLGHYDDRVKMNFSVLSGLAANTWRGGRVHLSAMMPVFDEIHVYEKHPRLTMFSFSQVFRTPLNIWGAFSGGYFAPDRWGGGLELNRYFLNRHVLLGMEGEYTGFLLYDDKEWAYSPLSNFTGSIYAFYHYLPLNVVLGISYNKFLMQDEGVRFRFSRYFGETLLGAYFTKTDRDKHGGFYMQIPLSRQKQPYPSRVRARLSDYYQFSYQASNQVYTYGEPIKTGLKISTGLSLTEFHKHLTPNYIKNNMHFFKLSLDYLN